MSATLDPKPIAAWLGAPAVYSEGRSFPVDIQHLAHGPDDDIAQAVATGVRQVLSRSPGDILAFLPGVREIVNAAQLLADLPVEVVQLYGALSAQAQDAALKTGKRQRVVLSTNVAETSVTIPGVRTVVDSGWARQMQTDHHTGLEKLVLTRISRASADQRAGRAGRVGPGQCLRLWTERVDRALDEHEIAEVRRLDLAGPLLQLLSWGEPNPREFAWYESPNASQMDAALRLLEDLGATENGSLTPIGQRMASVPLHPRLARFLIAAQDLGVSKEASLAAALLSERHPLQGQYGNLPSGSDLFDLVERAWKRNDLTAVHRVAKQLNRLVPHRANAADPEDGLAKAVLAAWPDRVVRRRDPDTRIGRMTGGKGVELHRKSAVRTAELYVALDVVAQPGSDALVRCASAVELDWLHTDEHLVQTFDRHALQVRARREVRYRDLVLESHTAQPEPVGAALVLANAAALDIQRVTPTTDDWTNLRNRLTVLHRWSTDDWPEPTDDWLCELLPYVCPGLRSFAQLKKADWAAAVRDHLGWQRWTDLKKRAPERIQVPNGHHALIDYSGLRPVLAVRIQALFGLSKTPAIDQGRKPLLLHLLAPNRRVQQVTDDLAGFWAGSYHDIRKELRARYPKHSWPEDPVNSTPPRKNVDRRRNRQ